jgi:acyl-CoA synthetase (NDP forming)
LVADLAQEVNLGLAEFTQETQDALSALLPASAIGNPLDVWGTRERDGIYERCMELVVDDKNVHMVAVSRDTPPDVARLEVEQSLDEAEAAIRISRQKGKPVLIFANPSTGFHEEVARVLDEGNVPYLQGTRETLAAIRATLEFATFQRKVGRSRVIERPSPSALEKWRARLGSEGSTLNELEGRELLAAYGIEGPDEGIAGSAKEAVAIARQIGFPVVLKILSRDIQHKTDIGGVRIGLGDEPAVTDAFEELMTAVRANSHTAQIDGVLVQDMIQGDVVEVILGMIHDPSYGPVIAFGAGGIFVEVAQDSALRLPPLDVDEARAQIEETRVAKLLKGVRGRAPADTEALVAALVRFSHLAVDLANYLEAIEINPLMVLPEGRGVRAVDVLVERGRRSKGVGQCA